MKTKRFIIPGLLMILLAACEPVELEIPDSPLTPVSGRQTADSVWTLTILADKGVDTKALDLTNEGNTLNTYWKETEKVFVYKGGTSLGTLSVQPATGDKPTTATLTGSINTSGLAQNDVLTLYTPRTTWNYAGQNGALTGTGSIEDTYAYASATVSVKSIDNENHTISTSGARFTNEQSIYRFQFLLNGNAASPVIVKDFLLWSSDKEALVQKRELVNNEWTSTKGFLCVKPDSDTSEPLYVAIRNEMDTPSAEDISAHKVVDTYNFVLTGSNHELYLASKGIPAHVLDAPGKFISATTIEAKQPDFSPAEGNISSTQGVF